MTEHGRAVTTHTTEMRQIREANTALARGAHPTARSIGLRSGFADDAVLLRLRPVGPPSYPYVYGVFTRDERRHHDGRAVSVELHTAQLRAISAQLHLRGHTWGV